MAHALPDRPGLGVVIPHYGDPAPTRALVESLIAQQPARIVVVDDHSPIPLSPIAGADVVRRDRNGGFGAAVNTGVAELDTELVLVLNSDLTIADDFVEELLVSAEPWLPAVVSPRVVKPTGEDEWVGRSFPTTGQQVVEWLTPVARFRPRLESAVGHDVAARGRTAVVDWVIGAAMLLPVAAFRDVGGMDERFHMNSEEVDLQRRLAERGVRSVVLADPVVVHEGGGSSDPARSRAWLVQSRLRYAEKWHGRAGRLRLQAALTAATGVNLTGNAVRRAAGRPIHPIAVARDELSLIWKDQQTNPDVN